MKTNRRASAVLKESVNSKREDWNKIIVEWNKTEAWFPENKTIPDIFAEKVEEYPSSIALTLKDKKLTYKELHDLSSNLARYLSTQTSQMSGKIIALYIERSFESFISALGVLKTGAAYLPLHLHFPAERIRMILEDAKVDTLITQKKLLPQLEVIEQSGINIIPIETILTEEHRGPVCLKKIYSHDLAYIIYTSGTTGKPKGIKISHKGVCNLITHVRKDFGVIHNTKVLQFASLSFDASVYEWAGALLNGAELCILAEDELPPKADLAVFLREKKINFALLPPPILESIDHSNLNELHTLVSGGEACTQNIVDKWADGRSLFNAYGPSEATVACSFSRCYPRKVITIGKPIQNVKLYVLDEQANPVPIGVPGELYIGGAGLAQGYLNRKDLTDKAFIPNPFSSSKNDLIYKTGDRVRWLENGELEYIDRIDSQVKLEGYRIELGEVESIVGKFSEIESSSVIVQKIDDAHKQLIAFYTLKKGIKKLNKECLNKFMKKSLPQYMVPAHYIKLESLPLTLTNKIDREALIKIYEASKNQFDTNSPTELIPFLEQTWRELLNCEDVSGNFFSLGGDSIRAIQLVAILRKQGYLITSKALYDNPTIAELANTLSKEKKSTSLPSEKNSIAQGTIKLSPIQHWFFEHGFKAYNQWNQAFLFQTNIPVNKEYFQKAWEVLIKHHDTLRLRYKLDGNNIKQYYDDNKKVCSFILEEFDLSRNKDLENNWITNQCIKLQNSLNIEKGPVLAVGLFNYHPDGQQRVLIAIHHLLVDGISWRILLEDLLNIYDQLLQFQAVKFLPKSDHYGNWVKALYKYAKQEGTQSQKVYWEGISQQSNQQKKQEINLIQDQEHYALNVSENITLGILQDLPTHYPLHINDILLAALAFSLYKHSKNYEFLIDMEGHGREECIGSVDVTRTIGWFTSIFPVCLRVPSLFQEKDDSKWSELMLSIKQEMRKVPDKGIGYGVLRYLTNETTKKQLSNNKTLVLFNYLGQFDLVSKHQGTWSFASESPGNPIGTDYFGSQNYSRYPLEVNALVAQGVLHVNFNYNKQKFSKEEIKFLASCYNKALEKFVILGRKLSLANLYLPSDSSINKLFTGKFNIAHKSIENEQYVPFSLVNVVEYKNIISDLSLIEDIYPASYLQARMLLEATKNNKGTYHIVSNYSVHAKFDKNKLLRILNGLANKHELLRAAFFLNKEERYNVVIFKSIDLDYQIYKNKDSKDLIEKEKLNGFIYSKPGLFRAIINEKDNNFDLIFSFHNALEDGWSMATLINEFGQAYINDQPIGPKLSLRYGEFVRNELAAVENQNSQNFWQKYLYKASAVNVNWKFDKEKSENSLYSSVFALDTEQVKLIHDISRELKIGVDSVFLLSYLKTLSYFTDKSDVVVGIAANNRLEKEDGDKMFGLFINIMPFRFNLRSYSNDFDCILALFKNKIKLQQHKNMPYDYIKSFFNHELYNFVFDFVHLHVLNERVPEIESINGYERTHIPFTLTVAQKGEEAFTLGVSAHDDFISIERLNDFILHFKRYLLETINLIQDNMSQEKHFKAGHLQVPPAN